MVRDELGIPEQTRYLVPVDLGRVEKHVNTPHRLFPTFFLIVGYFSSTIRAWNRLSLPWVSMPVV